MGICWVSAFTPSHCSKLFFYSQFPSENSDREIAFDSRPKKAERSLRHTHSRLMQLGNGFPEELGAFGISVHFCRIPIQSAKPPYFSCNSTAALFFQALLECVRGGWLQLAGCGLCGWNGNFPINKTGLRTENTVHSEHSEIKVWSHAKFA